MIDLKRLRFIAAFLDDHGIGVGDSPDGPFIRDVADELEHLRAAQSRPDDGEPLTAEWLDRVMTSGGPVCYWVGVGNVSVGVWSADPSHHPQWRMNAFHGPWANSVEARTRGDVRRLCIAIGIELRG